MDDLTAARERHVLCPGRCVWFEDDYPDAHCHGCGERWPCDAALALAALDESMEWLHRLAEVTRAYMDAPDPRRTTTNKLGAARVALSDVLVALAKWEASK